MFSNNFYSFFSSSFRFSSFRKFSSDSLLWVCKRVLSFSCFFSSWSWSSSFLSASYSFYFYNLSFAFCSAMTSFIAICLFLSSSYFIISCSCLKNKTTLSIGFKCFCFLPFFFSNFSACYVAFSAIWTRSYSLIFFKVSKPTGISDKLTV